MTKTAKISVSLAAAVLLVFCLSFGCSAEEVMDDSFTYTVVSDTLIADEYIGTSPNVTLPEKVDGKRVVGISAGAFSNTDVKVLTISFSGDIRSYDPAKEELLDYLHFYSCPMLTSIKAQGDAFAVEDGVLFNKDKTVLYQYPALRSGIEYYVPDSVKEIAPLAFEECSELVTLYLPEGLEKIGSSAFFNCDWLSEVVTPLDSQEWQEKVLDLSVLPNGARLITSDINVPAGRDDYELMSAPFSSEPDEYQPEPAPQDVEPEQQDVEPEPMTILPESSSEEKGGMKSALLAVVVCVDIIGVFVIAAVFITMRARKNRTDTGVPGPGIPQQSIPKTDIPVQEIPVTETPQQYTPITEEPQQYTAATEEPQQYTAATEVPQQYTPVTEEPQQYTPVTEEPQQYTPVTEIPQQYTPMTETPQQYTPMTETPQQYTPMTEVPQQYTSVTEIPLTSIPTAGYDESMTKFGNPPQYGNTDTDLLQ